MTCHLYELSGANAAIRFSPYCWRARLSLTHKGRAFEPVPVLFTKIKEIEGTDSPTVPVLKDGDTMLSDSWAIAEYLDKTYADQPTLIGEGALTSLSLFVENWANTVMMPGIAQSIIFDVYSMLDPADQDYFRQTREARFGRALQDIQAGREDRVETFRASLTALRRTLEKQDFIAGDAPAYADISVFGPLQWAKCCSSFQLLSDDDPIAVWFGRMTEHYDVQAETV